MPYIKISNYLLHFFFFLISKVLYNMKLEIYKQLLLKQQHMHRVF